MALCGFQHSTGSSTGNQFDGLKAIFCHKYYPENKRMVTIFNAKGGNTPTYNGQTKDIGPNAGEQSYYLGDADCGDVPNECYTGLDCSCYDDHPGGCGGIIGRTDHCYCPNYPICPYGALDGVTDADFSHDAVTCEHGQVIDSV